MKSCKNKYNCSFNCKNCLYDDIEHFKQLYLEVNERYKKKVRKRPSILSIEGLDYFKKLYKEVSKYYKSKCK